MFKINQKVRLKPNLVTGSRYGDINLLSAMVTTEVLIIIGERLGSVMLSNGYFYDKSMLMPNAAISKRRRNHV